MISHEIMSFKEFCLLDYMAEVVGEGVLRMMIAFQCISLDIICDKPCRQPKSSNGWSMRARDATSWPLMLMYRL